MRDLATIDGDIAALKLQLHRLKQERARAWQLQRQRIVEMHGDGMIQREIATATGLSAGTVATVLWHAGCRKKRPALKTFPMERQREYRRARAHGAGPEAARQIAGCV